MHNFKKKIIYFVSLHCFFSFCYLITTVTFSDPFDGFKIITNRDVCNSICPQIELLFKSDPTASKVIFEEAYGECMKIHKEMSLKGKILNTDVSNIFLQEGLREFSLKPLKFYYRVKFSLDLNFFLSHTFLCPTLTIIVLYWVWIKYKLKIIGFWNKIQK